MTGVAAADFAHPASAPPAKSAVIPTVIKNDRWHESLFGAPPPANPARDTNRRNRWKSQRFRRLVSVYHDKSRGATKELPGFVSFEKATFKRSPDLGLIDYASATGRSFD